MRRSDCQHKPHVEQLSVLPTCSGQRMLSAGFCRTLAMVTVERSGNGPLETRMANLAIPRRAPAPAARRQWRHPSAPCSRTLSAPHAALAVAATARRTRNCRSRPRREAEQQNSDGRLRARRLRVQVSIQGPVRLPCVAAIACDWCSNSANADTRPDRSRVPPNSGCTTGSRATCLSEPRRRSCASCFRFSAPNAGAATRPSMDRSCDLPRWPDDHAAEATRTAR